MKEERFYFNAGDGRKLSALLSLPEGEAIGCFQILHGVAEHKERYRPLMVRLSEKGWLCLIHDHRGHGESIRPGEAPADLGQGASPEAIKGDCLALRRTLYERCPDLRALPFVMLGHSMGSFMLRTLLLTESESLAGAIVMGTGSMTPVLLRVFGGILSLVSAFHPGSYQSPLINQLGTGGYGKRFAKEGRGPNAWLSRSDEQVRRYSEDPLCGTPGSLNTYHYMKDCFTLIQDPKELRRMRKDLPLLLLSGEDDPVGNFGEGPRNVLRSFQDAGLTNVDLNLYPKMRHEVINELGSETVIQDILKFLDGILAS